MENNVIVLLICAWFALAGMVVGLAYFAPLFGGVVGVVGVVMLVKFMTKLFNR